MNARQRLTRALDRRTGIDTSGTVTRSTLGFAAPEYRHYEPSYWLALAATLPRSQVRPDDVLIDLGSGKGRVVLQAAARYRMRRVIGVELSERLHEVACANRAHAKRLLRTPDVTFLQADAATMTIPTDVTIAYLFNPFRGSVFDAAMDRLGEHARTWDVPLRIVYVHPFEHDRLVARPDVTARPPIAPWRLRIAGLPANGARLYDLRP